MQTCYFSAGKDFLIRYETFLKKNSRRAMQRKSLARLVPQVRDAIAAQADAHRQAQK